MDLTTETNKFVIAKGFIEGRDAAGRSVYGLFISASGYQKTLYFREIFTNDPIDRAQPWPALLALLNDESAQQPTSPSLSKYKGEFHNFAAANRLFEHGRGHMDPREIEHKISYFCSHVLNLSAVTFLELTTVMEDDLSALIPFISEQSDDAERREKETDVNAEEDDDESQDLEKNDEQETRSEIFIACEPVLDPVSGIATGKLSVGDAIMTRLPETSSFYQFLTSENPSFDGIIEGNVTGIRINEYDVATVAVKLADGISGALKLSGSVRVKRGGNRAVKEAGGLPEAPEEALVYAEIMLAALAVAIFLVVVMCFLLYVID
jgi:hypothetical protein